MPSGDLGRTRKWKGVCWRKHWGAGMGPSVLWALVQVCWGGEVCGSGLDDPRWPALSSGSFPEEVESQSGSSGK